MSIKVNKFFFILLMFIFSCKDQTEPASEKEEYEILNIVVKQIRPISPPPAPPKNYKNLSKIDIEIYNNKMRKKDSLEMLKNTYYLGIASHMRKIDSSELDQINGNSPDFRYFSDSINLKEYISPKPINFTQINSNGNIKILHNYDYDKITQDKMFIGEIAISRVIFNKKHTKAVVKIDHYKGKHREGGGSIFFLKKINNTWKLCDEGSTWVS